MIVCFGYFMYIVLFFKVYYFIVLMVNDIKFGIFECIYFWNKLGKKNKISSNLIDGWNCLLCFFSFNLVYIVV